jgi:hypothetical protein
MIFSSEAMRLEDSGNELTATSRDLFDPKGIEHDVKIRDLDKGHGELGSSMVEKFDVRKANTPRAFDTKRGRWIDMVR